MENLQRQSNIEQPVVPEDKALAALIDRYGGALSKQYRFLCDYLNNNTDLKYLTHQTADAINQIIFTIGKMAHPPAIELKLGESLLDKF